MRWIKSHPNYEIFKIQLLYNIYIYMLKTIIIWINKNYTS